MGTGTTEVIPHIVAAVNAPGDVADQIGPKYVVQTHMHTVVLQ